MLPDILSQKLGKVLTNTIEEDISPTVYKANSIKKLGKICESNNFRELDLIIYQPPPYAFVFSKIICKLVINYYKTINKHDSLKFLRRVIIARFKNYIKIVVS